MTLAALAISIRRPWLAGSNNLGTGGDMITETDGAIATNRPWHTPSRPSRLILN